MTEEKLSTGQKALQINLDAKKYGTFAEIGAGQEVAGGRDRWLHGRHDPRQPAVPAPVPSEEPA